MSDDNHPAKTASTAPATVQERSELVVRSIVPDSLTYGEYRPYLRIDFFHSCAYCTIMETEARGVRFTIDHYEPQIHRGDLENEYNNLMYSCDTCNIRKGSRHPTPEARQIGKRFFRPDQDLRSAHFEKDGIYIGSKTEVGRFTISALDLNRRTLKRVRELRERLGECNRWVIDGIQALRAFPMDTLPLDIRARAKRKISEAEDAAQEIAIGMDAVLNEYAKSALLDPDEEAPERAKAREAYLKESAAMVPGFLFTPRKRRAKSKRK